MDGQQDRKQLYSRAVSVCRNANFASINLLQTELRISNITAQKIIHVLLKRGVIDESDNGIYHLASQAEPTRIEVSGKAPTPTSPDLAGDGFISKWPHWIRWACFLPAALFGGVLVSGIFFLLNTSFNDVREGSFLYLLMDVARTGLLGGLFVYFGSYVAPMHQLNISVILACVAGVFAGVALMAILQSQPVNIISDLLAILALVAGAVIAVISIKEAQ